MSRALVIIALIASAAPVAAKDLGHRLGLGYTDQFGLDSSLPSVALRFWPTGDFGVQLAAGLSTPKDDAKFGLGLKGIRTIFREQNLNFFAAAQAGLVSDEEDGRTHSGFMMAATVGVEFFFAGLENLSFNVEAGVGVNSVSNEVRVRTIGDHPLRAGIFFYF